MKVAAVNFRLRSVKGTGQYFGHLTDLITHAYDHDADVVVLPELHVLELLALAPDLAERNVAPYLTQFADEIEAWFARIANSTGLTIVSGSHLREMAEGDVRNVGVLCRPGRDPVRYEKNNLTRYEAEMWALTSGRGLVATEDGLGVNVCYDCEFSPSGLALAAADVWVHLVPAWTEMPHGFLRVRNASLARATETQSFVVQASLVGDFGREPVPTSHGSSAILAPSIEPFPVGGVLAETAINEEGVAIADLDRDALLTARRSGEVSNHRDIGRGDWTVMVV